MLTILFHWKEHVPRTTGSYISFPAGKFRQSLKFRRRFAVENARWVVSTDFDAFSLLIGTLVYIFIFFFRV